MTEKKNPFEALNDLLTPKSEQEKLRASILQNISLITDAWPDMLAAWKGMLTQTIDDGWEEMAARGIVLSSIVNDPLYFAANVKQDASE